MKCLDQTREIGPGTRAVTAQEKRNRQPTQVTLDPVVEMRPKDKNARMSLQPEIPLKCMDHKSMKHQQHTQ